MHILFDVSLWENMGSWALIRQLEDTEADRQDRPHGKFDSNELLPAASSKHPPPPPLYQYPLSILSFVSTSDAHIAVTTRSSLCQHDSTQFLTSVQLCYYPPIHGLVRVSELVRFYEILWAHQL